jgi:hypothetical protein
MIRVKPSVGQVRVCNDKYVLDRVNRHDGFSMKKPFLSAARGASFHTKHASNVNVVRVVLLDANSYLAYWSQSISSVAINPLVAFENIDGSKRYCSFILSRTTLESKQYQIYLVSKQKYWNRHKISSLNARHYSKHRIYFQALRLMFTDPQIALILTL